MQVNVVQSARWFAALVVVSAVCVAQARQHFLVMGGGPNPSNNQLSLERNIHYFERVRELLDHEESPRDLMFACGEREINDLVYIERETPDASLRAKLAAIIGPYSGVDEYFRAHDVGGGEIATTHDNITKWFDSNASKLTPEDSLMIYFTGHGGKAEKDTQNTSLYLWGRRQIRMTEVCEQLDKLPKDLPVVLVMVQCYAGGFANVIFKDGDPKKGLSQHNRVGFFATVYSKPAAGCTPHVDEAEYQEYSSYFWAALCGENRIGEKIERPDYNEDGVVSFDEAHAYALITSDSSDISMKTSDCLLRHYSRTKRQSGDDGAQFLTPSSPFGELADAATPLQRIVLDELSERLELKGDNRIRELRGKIAQLNRDKKNLVNQRKKLDRDLRQSYGKMKGHLLARWPQLKNPWNAQASTLLAEHGEQIRKAIEKHPEHGKVKDIADQRRVIDDRVEKIDGDLARCARLAYLAETIALAANLEQCAEPAVVEAYQTLLQREAATLSE
ncbi:MAG: hypothetical protein MI741_08975 [Rhodospirillales bacterium]|nr:hypothetical protein [Rhodospirillales bacterium]